MVKVYYRIVNLILTNILSVIIGFVLGGCVVMATNKKDAKKQNNKEKTKKTDDKEEDSTYKRTGTMGFYIET